MMGNGHGILRRERRHGEQVETEETASIFTICSYSIEHTENRIEQTQNNQVQLLSYRQIEQSSETENNQHTNDFPLLTIGYDVTADLIDQTNVKQSTFSDEECTDIQIPKSSSFESLDSAFSDKSHNSNGSNKSCRLGVGEMVNLHKELLAENLNVVEILPHLACILENRDVLRLNKLATNQPFEAVEMMIDAIKLCDDKGKWQLFIEALVRAEYNNIAQILKGELDPFKDENNKKLLRLYHSKLISNIYVPDVAELLYEKGVINAVDHDQIQREYKTRGQHQASFSLLLRISSRHPHWYQLFLETLRICKMDYIVKEIEDTSYDSMNVKSDIKESATRKLPPLPSTPSHMHPSKQFLDVKKSSDSSNMHNFYAKEKKLKEGEVGKDSLYELCYLRNQIEKRTDELNKMRARYFVLEAEEEIYETIPCDEKTPTESDATLKSWSSNALSDNQRKGYPSESNFDENTDGHSTTVNSDDLGSSSDQGANVQMMLSIFGDCMRNIVTSEMQSLKEELKLHITKEMEKSSFEQGSQVYTSNYRGMHIGLSPIKLFDAAKMVHDPSTYFSPEHTHGYLNI